MVGALSRHDTQKRYYEKNKELGRCISCSQDATRGLYCETHNRSTKERSKEYREKLKIRSAVRSLFKILKMIEKGELNAKGAYKIIKHLEKK